MKKLTPLMLNLSNYLFGKQNILNKQIQDLCGYNTNLVDSLNSLGFKILQAQLNDNTENNFIFSPLSVLLIVSILNYGFGDLNMKARADLLGNLNLNKHRQNLHQLTGKMLDNLISSLNQTSDTQIDLLTMIHFADYLQIGYRIENELSSNYKALIKRYDFLNSQERNRALNETYRLIRQHTKNQFNLFSLKYLPKEASRLNIYSTLHLNSNWLDPFNSIHTSIDRFFNQNGKIAKILFMSRNTYVNVNSLTNRDLQLAELPFQDNQLSMILIYSSQRYALHEVLFSTKNDELNSAIKNLTRKYVSVRLPRFTVDQQLTIQQLLKPLKVNLAFDCKQSSLEHFSKRNRTCLDFNLLYTKLKLDEEGVNSIAQDCFYGQQKFDTIAPKLLIQSPFAFIIKHTETGLYLLLGLINHF